MFRRSYIRNVHLFTALLPTNLVKGPQLINKEHFGKIGSALDEAKCFVGPTTDASLRKAFALCEDVTTSRLSNVQKALDDVILELRGELNKVPAGKLKDDPLRRLQIHECIMAAGFYQRFMSSDIIHYGYGTRFILLYFNCDLRRDTTITTALHDSILVDRKSTEQSEKLLTDLFLLERKLFGKYRFVATGGRRWLCLGVSLDEVTSIDELNRLLELPCVKEHGNFVQRKVDTSEKELWYNVEVEPKEEPCFLTARMFQPKESESVWTLRVNKVIPLAVPGYLVVVLAYFLHDW